MQAINSNKLVRQTNYRQYYIYSCYIYRRMQQRAAAVTLQEQYHISLARVVQENVRLQFTKIKIIEQGWIKLLCYYRKFTAHSLLAREPSLNNLIINGDFCVYSMLTRRKYKMVSFIASLSVNPLLPRVPNCHYVLNY